MSSKKTGSAAPSEALETRPQEQSLEVYDYGEDVGGGREDRGQADRLVPFVTVLQSNSPQVTGEMAGAKPGALFNTATEQIYDGKDGIEFVPAMTQHLFVEWRPRDAGGGFIATHKPDSDVVRAAKAASKTFGEYFTPEGNELVETFYIYAVRVEDGQPYEPIVIGCSSTKIRPYKKWTSQFDMLTVPAPGGRKQVPPLWAYHSRLTTHKVEKQGNVWHNVDVAPATGKPITSLLPPGHPCMVAAKAVREAVMSGAMKADHSREEQTSGGGAGDQGGFTHF